MVVFGADDDLAMAYFGTEPTQCPNSTGGKLADALEDYSSLSAPIQPVVESVAGCGHICDVTKVSGGPVINTYNFLTD